VYNIISIDFVAVKDQRHFFMT